jgi:hypothetical protein
LLYLGKGSCLVISRIELNSNYISFLKLDMILIIIKYLKWISRTTRLIVKGLVNYYYNNLILCPTCHAKSISEHLNLTELKMSFKMNYKNLEMLKP